MPGRSEVTAFLGLGGNLGDPQAAMSAALRAIDSHPHTAVEQVSSVYRTPPWGEVVQPDFLNAVARLSTGLAPRDLLDLCLGVENGLKRVRTVPGGPRVIDVDILWYDGRRISEENLEIPHPRMTLRAFVLVPLQEIAPDLTIDGQPLARLIGAVDGAGIEIVRQGPDWWREPDRAV